MFIDTNLGDVTFWCIVAVDIVIVALRDTQSVGYIFGSWGKVVVDFLDGDMASVLIDFDKLEVGKIERSPSRDEDSKLEEAAFKVELVSTLGFMSEMLSTSSIILAIGVESLVCCLSSNSDTCKRPLTLGLSNGERKGATSLYFCLMAIQLVVHIASREFARRWRRHPTVEREKLREVWIETRKLLSASVVLSLVFLLSAASRHRHTVTKGGIYYEVDDYS